MISHPTRSSLAIAFALGLVAILAACGPDAATSTAAPSPAGSVSTTTSSPEDGSAPASAGSSVGQTDTDWGRIWDELPASFPSVPGSTQGEASATGPATADLVVEGVSAKDVVSGLQAKLESAGFATVGVSGPLEDGGYVLDMTGSSINCRIQVTASPLGGLVAITILYGAACPQS